MKKKVLVGISGGVDSAMSAYLLKEKGYEVIGISLNQYNEDFKEIITAKNVADFLKIEHHIYNMKNDIEKIKTYFLDSYNKGITPSPCIKCNELVKIKILYKQMLNFNCNYIATGHYCNISYDNFYKKTLLIKSKNVRKDQSYMLYRLKSEIIDKMIFPLGNYDKQYVRGLAKEIGLSIHNKNDSQDICFALEGYKKFLMNNLNIKKGNYIDKEKNVIGEHNGYQYYTVGQRRGLGIKDGSIHFVINIDSRKNEIMLGNYEDLFVRKIKLNNFVSNVPLKKLLKLEYLIGRPRSSSVGHLGKIKIKRDGVYFYYDKKNAQNANGQHLALYDKSNLVLGGGEIEVIN